MARILRQTILLSSFLLLGVSAALACQVLQVEAGDRYTAALREDGSVWVWGANEMRGDSVSLDSSSPGRIPDIDSAISIAAGDRHLLILLDDGTVWGWGFNSLGELGDTQLGGWVDPPAQISGLDQVDAISAGLEFSLARRDDGTLWAWGSNRRGQLGDGAAQTSSSTPVEVVGLAGVVAFEAGQSHALAVLNDGTARAWGAGTAGQLGNGIRRDEPLPASIQGLFGIEEVAAGAFHSLIRLSNGDVWSVGDNLYGQLGTLPPGTSSLLPLLVSGLDPAVEIEAGETASLARSSDGTVRVWGSNQEGLLGSPDSGNSETPMPVLFGGAVSTVRLGRFHGVALMDDGTVEAWGWNGSGELGEEPHLFERTPQQLPLATASDAIALSRNGRAFAVDATGDVDGWGNNEGGRLDASVSRAVILSPVDLSFLANVETIRTGLHHALVMMQNGSVYAWGENANGQLGIETTQDTTVPVSVDLPNSVADLQTGDRHSIALMQNGGVYVWGLHELAGSGIQSVGPAPVPALSGTVSIAAGPRISVFAKDDGSVVVFGRPYAHPEEPIVLPTEVNGLTGIVEVSAGWPDILARNSAGQVFAWDGATVRRITGLPSAVKIRAGEFAGAAVTASGGLWVWGSHGLDEPGDGPLLVDLGGPVADVVVGKNQFLVLRADGTVWSWGDNRVGGLGIGQGPWSWELQDPGFGDAVGSVSPSLRVRRSGGDLLLNWLQLHNAVSYNVWRSGEADFSTAQILGPTSAGLFSDDASLPGLSLYTVRGVDCQGVEGP